MKIPDAKDFANSGDGDLSGDLDALSAFKHFGGMTLDEAKVRFAENPLYYQEDFMFMGSNAFIFYFPVLDDYLRNVPDHDNDHDHESWIISRCIESQFHPCAIESLRPLIPQIVDLADFVRANLRRFGGDDVERQRVAGAWACLLHHIETCSGPAAPTDYSTRRRTRRNK
jgi:hypothetical protein